MGSGSTAIACMNTNRIYIGCELDSEMYTKSLDRIDSHCNLELYD
jgi:site-specific DNA-methyltransferase (adenine-specific)